MHTAWQQPKHRNTADQVAVLFQAFDKLLDGHGVVSQ
jgi:hypothetical protein